MHSHSKPDQPRLVVWEVTRSCNLSCVHCGAAAEKELYEGELSAEKAEQLLGEITLMGSRS